MIHSPALSTVSAVFNFETMKVVAFSPIRLNSKRVVGKNLKLLGGKPLLSYLFDTLVQVPEIDEIYAFCSSDCICPHLPEKVKFLQRDRSLDEDLVLGEQIYDAFVRQIEADLYILAHTTSPFVKANTVSNAVRQILGGSYDSAFSVEKIQTFAWYDGKPLNYSLQHVPRTQDITPVYIENSAFYMFSSELWLKHRQRIGFRPYLAVMDRIEGVDIDNPEDFEFAEKFLKLRDSCETVVQKE